MRARAAASGARRAASFTTRSNAAQCASQSKQSATSARPILLTRQQLTAEASGVDRFERAEPRDALAEVARRERDGARERESAALAHHLRDVDPHDFAARVEQAGRRSTRG